MRIKREGQSQVRRPKQAPSGRLGHQPYLDFIPPYTFSEERYYAIGRCGGVYALDILINRIQWAYRPEILGQSPAAIYHGTLYTLFNDGEIHAIDPQSGETRGVLRTNLKLPGYFTDAIGITANEFVLVVTFYDIGVTQFKTLKVSVSKFQSNTPSNSG